jgi:hypothetical protein
LLQRILYNPKTRERRLDGSFEDQKEATLNDSNLRQKSPIREWRPLPSDRVIYRDLPSHVVDWTMLEEDLGHRNGFCGVVEITTSGRVGRVYYLEAQAVGSHVHTDEGWQRTLGAGSVADLLREADARLSVFSLEAAVVRLSIAAPRWNVLRTAVASPAVLLEWLDDLELNAHTGEIELITDRGTGSVLLEYGVKVLISFSAPDAPPVFGLEALNMQKTAARWSEATLRVTGRDSQTLNQKPAAAQAVADQAPEPVALKTSEIIAAWRDVLEFTEFRTDSARGKGSFDPAWRAVCLELVDRYPQLDPFLDDVRYAAGQLSVSRPSGASFEALGAAYHRVLSKLSIPITAVRPLLIPLRDRHAAVWREAQLEVVCPL